MAATLNRFVPEPDDPIECVRCGLTPERAMAAKIPPALLVGPGRIKCDCYHPEKPYFVSLELEKREDRAGKPVGPMAGWYDVYLESLRRGEPGGGGDGGAKRRERKASDPAESRPEQDWQGFVYHDRAEVERLEKFVVVVKGRLPRWMRERWSREASCHGRNAESRLLRWYVHRHLIEVDDVPDIPRAGNKLPFKLLLTRQHADLWEAKKLSLGEKLGRPVSASELLAAVLLKEWT